MFTGGKRFPTGSRKDVDIRIFPGNSGRESSTRLRYF